MSKELKALGQIRASHLLAHVNSGNIGNFNIWFDEEYGILEKALLPPTVYEVCKALSKRYNNAGIQYLEDKKSFVFGYMLRPICSLKEDGTVYWGTNDLPPYLITMIGKFYEGEDKK